MIPLIMEEMQSHHWMTAEDITNLVAIAEMTPGPLGMNCATFAGTQTAGAAGGIAAVAGVLMPAFLGALPAAVFFTRFKNSSIMIRIMSFVKPVCIALIISVIISLGGENYFTMGKPDWAAMILGCMMLYLILKRRWSVPRVIFTSAALGILTYGFLL